ncbi:MAG: class I SAM-dependent methyltransferase [Sphingopyxis sp.]|nr:class I SAM-dependent methyltransferase [Sphingopyxis sp.]
MTGRGFDPATLAFYAAEAPVYAASGKNGISRHLEDFVALLTPGAHILELGCGGGRDAEYLMAHGFAVDPTDGVPAMAAKAEARLGCPVRVMRFDELDAVERYDAIVASASLLHVPRADLPDIVRRIWRALRPGGWHIASYKGGGTEGRDRFGRYFNYLSRAQLEVCYQAAAAWHTVAMEEGMGGGYDGIQGPWVKVLARR